MVRKRTLPMREKTVDAMLEEYRALRSEIDLYHRQQNQSVNFSLIGVIAVASAFGTLQGTQNAQDSIFPGMLLLGLALFVILNGIAFADRSIRIKRIAGYLDGCLRVELVKILGGPNVWSWEIFKRVSHEQADSLTRVGTLLLDYFRLSLFWAFPLGSILLYFWKVGAVRTLPEVILLTLNLPAFVVLAWASRQIQETLGSGSHDLLRDAVNEISAQRAQKAGDPNDKRS